MLLWRKGMEDPLEELETNIETFNRELDTLGREREESIYLLYRETDMLGKMVREDIADFQKATLEKLSGELPEFIDSSLGKHSVPETVNMTNAFIATSIESLLTRWRVQERQKVPDSCGSGWTCWLTVLSHRSPRPEPSASPVRRK